jgi:hypothetical protein
VLDACRIVCWFYEVVEPALGPHGQFEAAPAVRLHAEPDSVIGTPKLVAQPAGDLA